MASPKTARAPRSPDKPSAGAARDTTAQGGKSRPSKGIPAPRHPSSPASGTPDVVATAPGGADGDQAADLLKKPELLGRLSAVTGLPKSRVRPVMEAMLEILGEAVADGREMQLPPMGKVKPLRSKEQGAARISHLKIRQVAQKETDGAKAGAPTKPD